MKKNSSNLKSIKIVVTGAYGSGKTHFIKTISNNEILSTEKNISELCPGSKKTTTVAMDFAKVKLDGLPHLLFFGTPGQERFDFMWEILSYKMLGGIIMIDSHKFYESIENTKQILNYFLNFSTPIVIAANKQDLPKALSIDKIREELKIPKNIPILPCIATHKQTTEKISRYLVKNILQQP